jgi:hypothetical protein
MSLTKKRRTTEKRAAASRANGKLSHGPATPNGRGRIREANTRHGFYAQAEAVALSCLGEDAAELEHLRNNLGADMQPPTALEGELAEHLVQVLWRWKRAARAQEGHALRRARDANLYRDDRLHAQMMRLRITADTLRQLAQSVAREHYITTSTDLAMMKRLHLEGAVKEMGEIALALFYRLEERGETDDEGLPIDEEERARLVVAQVKSIFGIGMNNDRKQKADMNSDGQPEGGEEAGAAGKNTPPSRFSPTETLARERARQLLQNILTRQVELCEAQRNAILKESLSGPSPYERAAEVALAHPETALMQRMEESSFRQIWRITNLLVKMKHEARKEESR